MKTRIFSIILLATITYAYAVAQDNKNTLPDLQTSESIFFDPTAKKEAEPKKTAAKKTTTAKKTPAKKTTTTKKAAEKVEKEPAAKKTTTRRTKAVEPSFVLQYQHIEINEEELIARFKEQWAAMGNSEKDIKEMTVYLKPEEYSAYFVINGVDTIQIYL